jgi:hypothetical protein
VLLLVNTKYLFSFQASTDNHLPAYHSHLISTLPLPSLSNFGCCYDVGIGWI